MEKNLLIAGKDLPAGGEFADGMALAGFSVVIAGKPEEKKALSSPGIIITPWNKSSSISARSLVIQAETSFGPIENAVLYFDSPMYSSQFTSFSVDECPRALDAMTAGYEYLAMELLNRFEQHKTAGKLIFILKTHPSVKDVLHSSQLKNSTSSPANPIVSAAEAAFAAFAENVAAYAGDRKTASVLLVTGDFQNEVMHKDSSLASWLAGYIEAVDALKNKPGAKASASWIKAGAKNPGSFSLFH